MPTSQWVAWISAFTFGTVNLAIFIVEAASTYWLMTVAAEETTHVKRILHSIHHLLIAM